MSSWDATRVGLPALIAQGMSLDGTHVGSLRKDHVGIAARSGRLREGCDRTQLPSNA